MRHLLRAMAVVSLCGSAAAQWRHLPDADPTSGSCDAAPFGGGSGHWTNQRTQFLLRAGELGAVSGPVLGLGFAACGTGAHRHARLRIALAHVAPGFGFAGNVDFDSNLAAARDVTLALDATEMQWWSWQDQWSSVGLQRGFLWNGRDDVLVDVLALGNSFSGPVGANPGVHQGAPRERLWLSASGGLPPPPQLGRADNFGPRVRLGFAVGDAAQQQAGCNGLQLSLRGDPAPGQRLDATVMGGFDSAPVLMVGGTPFGVPPVDLAALGLPGCLLHQDLVLSWFGIADSAGVAVLAVDLPANPGLFAARVRLQALAFDRAPALRAVSPSWLVVIGR